MNINTSLISGQISEGLQKNPYILVLIQPMTPQTAAHEPDSSEQLYAIKMNDETALKALYTDNYQQVEKYVVQNNGSPDEARDIYQEAFIAVWRNIQLNRFDARGRSSLNAYLCQVARNKWLDHLRSARYKRTSALQNEESVADEAPASEDEEQKRLDAIKINIRQLGGLCKEVLTRFYYRRESLRTISEGMNWTEATARNNKYRCLQKLRELINKK